MLYDTGPRASSHSAPFRRLIAKIWLLFRCHLPVTLADRFGLDLKYRFSSNRGDHISSNKFRARVVNASRQNGAGALDRATKSRRPVSLLCAYS